MWIVRIALDRPYTFIVLAVLILFLSPVVILRTPTDMFPVINIPVIAVAWQYTGMNPEELEDRLTSTYERVLTTTVDNIEHLESTTVNGQAFVRIYLQPGASLDTANAQVTAISQTILRQLPPGTLPPIVINYSASSVPILQLGISGQGLPEQQLNDLSQNFLRPQLVTVPGAVVPYSYGGKQRQVMIDLNESLIQSKGLSPQDVLTSVQQQNLILPSGTAKIGPFEYDVRANFSPKTIPELNDIPVKVIGKSTIYLRDVANIRDGFSPQTNIVRQDGHRGALVTILKAGNASTIDVVKGVRNLLPRAMQTLPPELKIVPLADQSVFVRSAVSGVIRKAVIAACLTGLMILLFLGSWRSTVIIAVSIPLSILTSVMILSFRGETINVMTLGGLALAVGILVDDATVTIENMERYFEEGHTQRDAILGGAAQIAVPALVSTLCICIVLLPMFMLGGTALLICAAGRGCDVRSARLVRSLANACSYAGNVSAESERRALGEITESSGAIPTNLRGDIWAAAEWLSGPIDGAGTPASSFLYPAFFSGVSPCFSWCHSLVRISFQAATTVKLSSIFAPRVARASRRRRRFATSSRAPSGVKFPSRKWTTFSTTLDCPTAASITCTPHPASSEQGTLTSLCLSKRNTIPAQIMFSA
jgi:multidrug efflux pump subunit AcrB